MRQRSLCSRPRPATGCRSSGTTSALHARPSPRSLRYYLVVKQQLVADIFDFNSYIVVQTKVQLSRHVTEGSIVPIVAETCNRMVSSVGVILQLFIFISILLIVTLLFLCAGVGALLPEALPALGRGEASGRYRLAGKGARRGY